METNIIPSMKETLFYPTISNMQDSLVEIAEVGLDALFDDGILKNIPILGTIAALCKTGVNLRERNLIKQTAVFIQSFNEGSIDPKKLDDYRKTLENKEKAEKELGRVILLLDRMIEEQQSRILGRIYRAYVAGGIKWDKFVELSEINARMLVGDYEELDSIARMPIKQDVDIPDKRRYRIQRLVSLGLVLENGARLYNGNMLSYPDTDNRFVLSALGGTFFGLMRSVIK